MKKLLIDKTIKCKNTFDMFNVYVKKSKEIDILQKITNKRNTGNKYELEANFNYDTLELNTKIYNNINE